MTREAAGYAHADRIINCIDKVGTDSEEGGLDYRDAKVMMDSLKWAAEPMLPKAYSRNLSLELTYAEDAQPVIVSEIDSKALRIP